MRTVTPFPVREVDDVKRLIDLMALAWLNRLHLHLTDDGAGG
ncbi:MAG: family 20 glycosylhydrolase [Caldilineae bacterium]|nr:family 20 glycosylhydrolase [Caldilineae bacterium]